MERQSNNHGFTLIEATIAMVLLAMAAAGILLPFANAAAVQAEASRQTLSANLASELMEKVLLADPNTMLADTPAGYNNYTEADGTMLDTFGNPLTDLIYAGFSRSVTCQDAMVKSVPLVLVTVSVRWQGNEMTRVTTLMGE
ncbi:MAG: prepilin-type N-terminal cleavage/methylation domain-containing protein [Planctomycetota bacterium]